MKPNSTRPNQKTNICKTCRFDIKNCEPTRITKLLTGLGMPKNPQACEFQEPKIATGSMWNSKRMLDIMDYSIALIILVLTVYSIYKHVNS